MSTQYIIRWKRSGPEHMQLTLPRTLTELEACALAKGMRMAGFIRVELWAEEEITRNRKIELEGK